jgi:hypothetical protein
MIVRLNYVYAQQQDHFVFAHISDRMNLLSEKFQNRLATAMFLFIHLID